MLEVQAALTAFCVLLAIALTAYLRRKGFLSGEDMGSLNHLLQALAHRQALKTESPLDDLVVNFLANGDATLVTAWVDRRYAGDVFHADDFIKDLILLMAGQATLEELAGVSRDE